MTLHERRDIAVLAAEDQITFPMTGDGSVLYRCGSLADRDGVSNPAVITRLLGMVA